MEDKKPRNTNFCNIFQLKTPNFALFMLLWVFFLTKLIQL